MSQVLFVGLVINVLGVGKKRVSLTKTPILKYPSLKSPSLNS